MLKSKSICFSSDRTLREAVFVDSNTSFCQHILVSQKDNLDILEAVLPRKAPNKGSTPSEINFFLKKEERDGTGFNFPAFKRDGSGFDFPVRPCMAISLLVAGQSVASISWKPSRDMGEV